MISRLQKKNPAATDLAIFDANAKKLTYVTGLPENVTSIGKTVYSQNGNVYIPVNVKDESPAIYAINVGYGSCRKGCDYRCNRYNRFRIYDSCKIAWQ